MTTLLAALLLTAAQNADWELYRKALVELEHPPADLDRTLILCRSYLENPAFDPKAYLLRDRRREGSSQVRGEAQALLAGTLEAAGQIEPALAAYRDCLEKFPRPCFCGNGQAMYKSEAWMGQARCLERLGRHAEAIDLYFKVSGNTLSLLEFGAASRIVELYEAAGKLDDLKSRLDQRDRDELESWTRTPSREIPRETLLRYRSSIPIRVLLDIVDEERAGRWSDLIRRLDGRDDPAARIVEAAHRLARHPRVAVPLLIAELARRAPDQRQWICYALGLCGGPDAVLTLRKEVAAWPESGSRRHALYGLDLCGGQGRAVLEALSFNAHDSLKWAIKEVYGKAHPHQPRGPALPAIPEDLRLR